VTVTTRLVDLLSPEQRAVCDQLTERAARPPRGERLVDVLGLLLAPVLLLLARADSSRPGWGALLLACVSGGIAGVLLARLLADRRERLVPLLYGELARRERGEPEGARQA
jgi:hypothetical protein